jgi:holo-[acyl-carrier protein] synthase
MPICPGGGSGAAREPVISCPRGDERRRAILVVGLGIDLIELDRVAAARTRWGTRFVVKLMDPPEAGRLPPDEPAHSRALALAIAAKEAASKAIGTGWTRGVRWRDVEVFLDPTPRVVLHAAAAARARALGSAGATRTRLEVRGGLALGEVWLLA